jgi:hypothetical protein
MSLLLSNTRQNERSRGSSNFWNVRMAPGHFTAHGRAFCSFRFRNPNVVRIDNNTLGIMIRLHWRQDWSIICQKSISMPLFTKLTFTRQKYYEYITKAVYIGRLSVQALYRTVCLQARFTMCEQSILAKGRSNILHWVRTRVPTLAITLIAKNDAFKRRQRIFSPAVSWRWTQWKSDLTYLVYATTAVFFFMVQQPLVAQGLGIRTHNCSKRVAADPHLRPVFPNLFKVAVPLTSLFISHGTPRGKRLFFFKLIYFLVISYVTEKVVYCCWVSIYALINDVILFIYFLISTSRGTPRKCSRNPGWESLP